MPIVSATVVYIDSQSETDTINAGPCVKTSKTEVSMKMHKDVYMFVTPTFIKKYAKDLNSVISSKTYGEFVSYLQSLITTDIVFDGIYDNEGKSVAESELMEETSYTIQGSNFGTVKGSLTYGNQELDTIAWKNNEITFTAPKPETQDSQLLKLTTSDKKTKDLGSFTICQNSKSSN